MLKDKKITIIGQVEYETELGSTGFRDEPIPGGSNIWAYYRQLSMKEKSLLGTIENTAEVLFVINWRNDIDETMKVEYKGIVYEITRIDDFEGYKNDLKVYCKGVRS